MGMVANKIEVMLLTQNGERIHWELWLDNEISTELTNDKHLFDGASTVNAFAESIGRGFKDEFPFDDDYEPDPNFIKQYCDDFCGDNPYAEEDDDDDYTELKKLIKKYAKKVPCTEAFKKVVLLSNNQMEECRRFNYNLFDFEKKTFMRGSKDAKPGENYYDPDDCTPKSKDFMESLL